MADPHTQLGAMIREFRMKRGMTKAELARLIDVEPEDVAGLEDGIPRLIPGTLIGEISKALSIPFFSLRFHHLRTRVVSREVELSPSYYEALNGLAWKLRNYRQRVGLTLLRAGEELSIPPSKVGQWERKEWIPTNNQMRLISDTYELTPREAADLQWLAAKCRASGADPGVRFVSLLAEAERRHKRPPISSDDIGIFISYRRADESAYAGRLYDTLTIEFDEVEFFMDVDSIELGADFIVELEDALSRCVAQIVVIGKNWLTITDAVGNRRLDDPEDFVRLEIERALARDIPIIPILVDGASMPQASDLPVSLAPLARRNGRAMSNAHYGSDVLKLITTLEDVLEGR